MYVRVSSPDLWQWCDLQSAPGCLSTTSALCCVTVRSVFLLVVQQQAPPLFRAF